MMVPRAGLYYGRKVSGREVDLVYSLYDNADISLAYSLGLRLYSRPI